MWFWGGAHVELPILARRGHFKATRLHVYIYMYMLVVRISPLSKAMSGKRGFEDKAVEDQDLCWTWLLLHVSLSGIGSVFSLHDTTK